MLWNYKIYIIWDDAIWAWFFPSSRRHRLGEAVIVCPSSLCGNWRAEAPGLSWQWAPLRDTLDMDAYSSNLKNMLGNIWEIVRQKNMYISSETWKWMDILYLHGILHIFRDGNSPHELFGTHVLGPSSSCQRSRSGLASNAWSPPWSKVAKRSWAATGKMGTILVQWNGD